MFFIVNIFNFQIVPVAYAYLMVIVYSNIVTEFMRFANFMIINFNLHWTAIEFLINHYYDIQLALCFILNKNFF